MRKRTKGVIVLCVMYFVRRGKNVEAEKSKQM
jgi:hypothetical protein